MVVGTEDGLIASIMDRIDRVATEGGYSNQLAFLASKFFCFDIYPP
jgi:hypothetical protein